MSYYNYNPNGPSAGGAGTTPGSSFYQKPPAAPSSGSAPLGGIGSGGELRQRHSSGGSGPTNAMNPPQPSANFYRPSSAGATQAGSNDWFSAPTTSVNHTPAATTATATADPSAGFVAAPRQNQQPAPAFANPPAQRAAPPDSGQLMANFNGVSSTGFTSSTDNLSGLSGSISGPLGGSTTGHSSYPTGPMDQGSGGVNVPPPPMADDYENEPPLLEELGININEIGMKTRAVLFLFSRRVLTETGTNVNNPEEHLLIDNEDIVGPVAFTLLLGFTLLFTGKVHFGTIYGACLFGFTAMAALVNLLSPSGVSPWKVVSILGYSFLPVNILATVKVFIPKLPEMEFLGAAAGVTTIVWCTAASTRLLERSCDMRDQRWLVAYPAALFYSCFVLITIF